MKASQFKETRPHNCSSSAGAPSGRSFSTQKKDNTAGKQPFSKPGRAGEKAVAGASGSGRSSKQGSSPHDTKDTKGKSHGVADPSKTGITAALDPAAVASTPTKIKKPKAPKPPLDPNGNNSSVSICPFAGTPWGFLPTILPFLMASSNIALTSPPHPAQLDEL